MAPPKKRKSPPNPPPPSSGKRLRSKAGVVPQAARTFFFIREMFLMELLGQCDLLTIIALSHTVQYARDLVKAFFACNLRILVAFFVGDDNVDTFYTVLNASLSAIAGSVVSSVLSFPYRHDWRPDNLNIVVPKHHLFMWHSFLTSIGLSSLEKQPGVDRRYAHRTTSHVEYHSKTTECIIRLSESLDVSVLTPLIGATTTFSTNLATSSDFYCLYPYLLRNLRALEAWFPTPVRKAVAMGRRGIRSSFSTASWPTACGINCPLHWRYVRGLEGVGIFRWGGFHNEQGDNTDAGIPHTDNDLKWRLGDTCTNKHCRSRRGNYSTLLSNNDSD
ncbi:hypothetical protein C8F04DRAFT_1278205 [Mycena alexandri]|uniref:Uncharacterized protein n=1 Tax=Mycena alexandri TaxID=1745969 RepID=A0AAD6RYY8_9AGAR|nr:hypothetical protein C8F04DRAFT_1278205 [Mycena alexandri]